MSDGIAPVIEAGEEDFDERVIEASYARPVVVDFWAAWCAPCRTLGPVLERLARDAAGEWTLAKVDVDRASGLASRYGIRGIPAVKAFREGRVVDEFTGVPPEGQLREFLRGIVPTAADRRAADAARLESGDPAAAEAAYREALAQDSHHTAARIGLARLLVARHEDGEARSLLEPVVPAGETEDEVERLRAVLELRRRAEGLPGREELERERKASPGDAGAALRLGLRLAAEGVYEEALAALYAAGDLDRSIARDSVRPAMVDVFRVVGTRSALADAYRTKLASLLY